MSRTLLFCLLAFVGLLLQPTICQAHASERRSLVSLEVFSFAPCRELILTPRQTGQELLAEDESGRIIRRGRRLSIRLRGGQIVLDGIGCSGPLWIAGQVRLESGRVKRYSLDGVRVAPRGEALSVHVRLPFEDYLAGVVLAESAPWAALPQDKALESLLAQAIVCRSYALYYADKGRHAAVHFCDSTHCQAWRDPEGAALILRAVRETAGKALFLKNEIAPAFYSSTMAGQSVLPGEVWGDSSLDRFFRRVPASLPGEARPLAAASPHAHWSWTVTQGRLEEIVADSFGFVWNGQAIRIERTQGGIAARIHFGNETVAAEEFRLAFCKAVHWGSLRSLSFAVRCTPGEVIFTGRGLGHGVGMCQYGALELARRGWKSQRILSWYYPALHIGNCNTEMYLEERS